MHKAKKRFGQNFLHDPGIIYRIIQAIGPQPGDALVEIGPGRGALTYDLLDRCERMTAIELDRDLLEPLRVNALLHGELNLVSADALKIDFCEISQEQGKKLRVVGNLPYNISTPLLFHLIEQKECIHDMFFMLQREVVERMAAEPGTDAYGRLSVMIQYACYVEKVVNVGPGAFNPPPKVESAVVKLLPHLKPPVQVDNYDRFSKMVNQAFSLRRKTLRNSLKGYVTAEQMEAAGIDPSKRAERLTLQEFATLSNIRAEG